MRTLCAPLLLATLLLAGNLTGCSEDNDACEGRPETCLSLTLFGANGVVAADQLKVLILRKEQPVSPSTPLSTVQDFPFKVALLWPDGPGNLSVRSLLAGSLNGVSAELSLDLRNGQHAQRKLTLFPPLPGTTPMDMAKPRDLSMLPDLTTPKDLTVTPDLTATPDLSEPPDLTVTTD
jgi:hypothetical protein